MLTEKCRVILYGYDYMGPSMNPTLRAGDVLRVVPYKNDSIRIGDIVVLSHPKKSHNVVHRVVSVDARGIMTRGDNNCCTDPWVLSPDQIIGRVLSAQRGNRKIVIYGGIRGRILAFMLRIAKRGNLALCRILRPVYHWLAQSNIFKGIISRWIRIHVICFKRLNGKDVQLIMMGRWIVGRYLTENGQWQIRRPFRLFISKTSLNNR